jgi:polar amino acid transport system substrate-binding protein
VISGIWLIKNHPDCKLLKFEKNAESLQALANGCRAGEAE